MFSLFFSLHYPQQTLSFLSLKTRITRLKLHDYDFPSVLSCLFPLSFADRHADRLSPHASSSSHCRAMSIIKPFVLSSLAVDGSFNYYILWVFVLYSNKLCKLTLMPWARGHQDQDISICIDSALFTRQKLKVLDVKKQIKCIHRLVDVMLQLWDKITKVETFFPQKIFMAKFVPGS